jgi:hypothetical protein
VPHLKKAKQFDFPNLEEYNEVDITELKKSPLGTAFTGATTDLSDADVTDTYYDLFCVPVSPLTS